MVKIWKTFRFVWKYGWKKNPFGFILLTALTLLVGLLLVAGTWITKAAVDALGQTDLTWQLLAPVLLALFFKELGLNCGYSGIMPVLESKVRMSAVRSLECRMYQKIGRLPVGVREQEAMQERIARAKRFLGQEFWMFQFECTFVFRLLATCLGVALSLAYWSVWFPAITIGLVVPVILIRLKNNENLYRINQIQQRRKRRNEYLCGLFFDRSALGELSATGAEFPIIDTVERTARELTEERYARGQKDGLIQGASEGILSFVSFAFCVLLVVAMGEHMTVGAFAFLLEAVFLLQEEMINLGFNLKYFHESALYGVDLAELDAMEEEPESMKTDVKAGEAETFVVGKAERGSRTERQGVSSCGNGFCESRRKVRDRLAVEVNGLTFSYPASAGTPVLKNVSFTLVDGETIALVGPNGGGKSTLISLLLGLYPPDSGEIRIYGAPVDGTGREQGRVSAAVIFQSFLKYETTVKDNIVLGNIPQSDNRELISRAARLSTAETFFGRLEEGIDTKVGSVYQGAVNLSGGQWQRLAVARGFFADTPLLLLDEPNAAVDPVTEAELFRRYREGMEGRSGIIVSHRLAALQKVDRILVLEAGEIVEEGSHEELMRRKGHYYEMYLRQKNWTV